MIGPKRKENIEDLGEHFLNYLPPQAVRIFFITPPSPNEIAIEIKLP